MWVHIRWVQGQVGAWDMRHGADLYYRLFYKDYQAWQDCCFFCPILDPPSLPPWAGVLLLLLLIRARSHVFAVPMPSPFPHRAAAVQHGGRFQWPHKQAGGRLLQLLAGRFVFAPAASTSARA